MYLFRKEHIKLNDHISNLTDAEKARYTIKYNNDTLISSEIILGALQQKYGSFEIMHGDDTESRIVYWENFVARYIHAFKRIYDTLATEYLPLENYDKISEITTNGNSSLQSSSENTAQATTEESQTWRNTDKANGTSNTNGTSTNTTTEHTHGNIGVTTNAQMAIGEISLRTEHNLTDIIVSMYADMELI